MQSLAFATPPGVDNRLGQQPCEGNAGRTATVGLADGSPNIEDLPGAFLSTVGKSNSERREPSGFWFIAAELVGNQASGERTPREQPVITS